MWLLAALIFWMPLEHKYHKTLRKFSKTLIPEGVIIPEAIETKIYFYASDILAIFLLFSLVFAFKTQLRKIFTEKHVLLLWVFFISALISIWLSPLYFYSVIYTRLLQILTFIILFCFITQTPYTEKKTPFFLSIFVATALLQCVFALIQYFTQEPLGLRVFAESTDTPAIFSMPNGKRWLLDHLFHYTSPSTYIKRASGTLTHSNILGGLLMISLISTYSLIANASKIWIKRMLSASLILQFFCLCLTFSRSAFFGWIIGSSVWFCWAFFSRNLKSCAFVLKSTLLAISLCSILLFEQLLHRGGIMNYNTLVQNSDLIRTNVHSTAIQMIEDSPVFGVGFQQFAASSSSYVSSGAETPLAHNVFLLICAEMGIIALVAFVGFIALILYQAIKAPFTPTLASLLSIFIAFLFISICDFYPINLQEGKLMFFIIAALLTAEIHGKDRALKRALEVS